MLKEILLAILSLMGVIALIFLTFYASRALHKRMYSFSGKHIKIVEREMLSQDKSLIVVKQLAAFGAASNMLSGLDGLYMSIWLALPMAEWLYKKCYKIKYGEEPKKEEA